MSSKKSVFPDNTSFLIPIPDSSEEKRQKPIDAYEIEENINVDKNKVRAQNRQRNIIISDSSAEEDEEEDDQKSRERFDFFHNGNHGYHSADSESLKIMGTKLEVAFLLCLSFFHIKMLFKNLFSYRIPLAWFK